MFIAAIAHAETAERRMRLVDLRLATVADASGFDDALRKIDAAAERLSDRMKDDGRG